MDEVLEFLRSWYGTPYIYGGSSRAGIDCSGFAQEYLQAIGMDPPGDQSAQGLYDYFSTNSTWESYSPGALIFYGKDAKNVSHVGILLNSRQIIEASGGDHTTLTIEEALRRSACVRLRLVNYRPDKVAVLKPSFAKLGIV